MTKQEAEKIAREIVGKNGGVCLVPKPGHFGISSHEKTFCDCHVERLIATALLDAQPKLPSEEEIEDDTEEAAKLHANRYGTTGYQFLDLALRDFRKWSFEEGARWALEKLKLDANDL